MITAKTSSGFEIELDENIFRKDTELTEAMVFLDTDASGKCLFTAINSCLFAVWSQGKNAELKRQDGLSDKPGI